MDNLCLLHSSGTPGVCRSCALGADAKGGGVAVPFEGEKVSDEWRQRESELRAALEAERLAAEKAEREAGEIERAAQARAEAERKALEAAAERVRKEAELQAKLEEARKKREAAERRAREIREAAARNAGAVKTLALPGGATMEMIWCPPGSFMMGSPATEEGREDNETQHRVRLTKGFWLGKYPVTQKQWTSVTGDNPSQFKGDDRPVENVSWDDCQEFITKVNASLGCCARLPTEAEWEYACRAGTTTAYFWGNALNGDKANCDGRYPCGTETKGPCLGKTTPVGRYASNPWGFWDMHGNVWEWCNDWYGAYPTGSVTDPTGSAVGGYRVLRGGGWYGNARLCRSADRSRYDPGDRYSNFGFRLCSSSALP